MRGSPVRRTQEEIDELLAELRESGESVATFAKRRRLSRWTVYGWTAQARRQNGRRPLRRQKANVDFVEVKLSGSKPRQSIAFEVVLDGVGTVRIPSGFDQVELEQLLGVLRRPC